MSKQFSTVGGSFVGSEITTDIMMTLEQSAVVSGHRNDLENSGFREDIAPEAFLVSVDKTCLVKPVMFNKKYRPGQTIRLGQTGYHLMILREEFLGCIAGHHHEGSYCGGLRPYTEFRDGEFHDVTLGPACGRIRETITIVEKDMATYTASGIADIMIPELVQLCTSPAHVLLGSVTGRPDKHWVTPSTKAKLYRLSASCHLRTGAKLFYGDASLPWGGALDLRTDHQPSHRAYRDGNQIDVIATSETMPPELEAVFLEELRKFTSNFVLEGTGHTRHYHCIF